MKECRDLPYFYQPFNEYESDWHNPMLSEETNRYNQQLFRRYCSMYSRFFLSSLLLYYCPDLVFLPFEFYYAGDSSIRLSLRKAILWSTRLSLARARVLCLCHFILCLYEGLKYSENNLGTSKKFNKDFINKNLLN